MSASFVASSIPIFVLKIIGTVLITYIICSIIDYLRLLFFKVIKTKELSVRLGHSIEGIVDKILLVK